MIKTGIDPKDLFVGKQVEAFRPKRGYLIWQSGTIEKIHPKTITIKSKNHRQEVFFFRTLISNLREPGSRA